MAAIFLKSQKISIGEDLEKLEPMYAVLHICLAESLCCMSETNTTFLISYTSIFKNKNKMVKMASVVMYIYHNFFKTKLFLKHSYRVPEAVLCALSFISHQNPLKVLFVFYSLTERTEVQRDDQSHKFHPKLSNLQPSTAPFSSTSLPDCKSLICRSFPQARPASIKEQTD